MLIYMRLEALDAQLINSVLLQKTINFTPFCENVKHVDHHDVVPLS